MECTRVATAGAFGLDSYLLVKAGLSKRNIIAPDGMIRDISNLLKLTVLISMFFGRACQAPMEERRAEARESVQRRTSSSRSASTMTRASGSVPE